MKYAEYLGSAMRERVDKLQAQALDILSLKDELALMQDTLGQACQLYHEAIEQSRGLAAAQRASIICQASSILVDALNNVRDMTLAAHKLQEPGRQVDISVVHTLITQTVGILDQEIEENNLSVGMVERVAERLRQELLTVNAVATTRLTPERIDAEVQAMHDTVPDAPGSQQLRVTA